MMDKATLEQLITEVNDNLVNVGSLPMTFTCGDGETYGYDCLLPIYTDLGYIELQNSVSQ